MASLYSVSEKNIQLLGPVSKKICFAIPLKLNSISLSKGEKGIKVTLLGGKIPGSESWTDSEAGMKMGGGGAGWTQGHTFRKGIPMSRGEDCGV